MGNFSEDLEMRWKNLGWGVAASVICANAGATDLSFTPNAIELLRLPAYCQVKFNSSPQSPEWKGWRDRIGTNYIDLHHFCVGINFVNRYWGARIAKDRSFYLQNALNNFDYMVKAEKPDFTLSAELYFHRGEVFKLMRRPAEAVRDFNHALSIDPRFVKPYLQLADLSVAGKSSARALEIVAEGLRHVPDSKALQRRYLELGGKEPFPEPIVAKAAEPEPQPATTIPAVETPIEPVPAAVSPQPDPTAATEPAPTIGTPSNPYCRFCPPE
jgi:tetratricopeptide (TPR) repeat protein